MTTRWIETTLEVYAAIYRQHHGDLILMETLTDIDGRFGDPRILTVWGFKDADCGLIKSVGTLPVNETWTQWEYFIACVLEDQP